MEALQHNFGILSLEHYIRNITQMCLTGMHTMMMILRSAILTHLVAGAVQPSSSTKVMLMCVVWILTKTGTKRNCTFLH